MSARRTLLAALAGGAILLACAGQDPSGLENPKGLAGGVYYVSPAGNDAHPGTIAQPWRTIQHAADTLAAGDTVYIRAGTYHERVIPQRSGAAGQPITYAAYPGETATIDGSSVTLPDDLAGLFEVAGQSYIRVSGLRVVNAGPHADNAGILVSGSSHVTVEKCYTYHTTSSGIGVWNSEHVIIDGNEVVLACNDGQQECITVAGTDTFEVRNNHVHHSGPGTNGGEGIDAKDGSTNGQVYGNHVHHLNRLGIYVDAWDKPTHDIAVYRNVVHDVAADGFALASEMGGSLERIRVYNNVAYHNRYVGISLSGCCPEAPSHPMRDIQIVNNTLYDNGWEGWGGGIGLENPDLQDVTIRNNICSQNLYFQIALDPGVPAPQVTVDHNLIDGFRGTEGEIRGDDHVEGDPLFASPAGANFRLRPGSPAIDKGAAGGAPGTDFDGQARPYGAGYDIGADEYVPFTSFVYLPIAFKNYAGSHTARRCCVKRQT